MFSRLASAVTILVLTVGALAQGPITANTPLSVVVCQPVQLTWTGGVGPYFVRYENVSLISEHSKTHPPFTSLLPANQPGANAVQDFGTQTGTSVRWEANLPVGTSLFLQVRDQNGALGQSGTFTILTSTSTACLTSGGASTPPAAGGSSSTTAPGASTPAPPAAGGSSTSTRPPASGTGSTTTPAASQTGTNDNGAAKFASSGVLALAGVAAVAALL